MPVQTSSIPTGWIIFVLTNDDIGEAIAWGSDKDDEYDNNVWTGTSVIGVVR
jgi:hypothetical protein